MQLTEQSPRVTGYPWMIGVCILVGCTLSVVAEEPIALPRGAKAPTRTAADSVAAAPAGATEAVAATSTNLLARDPFWPVGYFPGKEEATNPPAPKVEKEKKPEAPPRWKEATRSLRIKGVLRVSTGKYVAMINDRIVGEGDCIEAAFAGRKYRWRIKSVSREGVRFQPLESELLGPEAE